MKKNLFIFFLPIVLLIGACAPTVDSCFTFATNSLTVTFSSACSIDAVDFAWDFGDGTTSTVPDPVHIYPANGTYTATLLVTDSHGNTSSSSELVGVNDCLITCIHGQCLYGNCICNGGFYGLHCDTAYNVLYSGVYTCNESCSPGGAAAPYSVTLTPFPGYEVQFGILGMQHSTAYSIGANVHFNNRGFWFPRQILMAGYEIASADTGRRNADGRTITFDYNFYQVGDSLPFALCSAVLTR